MATEMILREEMKSYLRDKWGHLWEEHPSWKLSKPGEMVPRAAMELLGLRSEPLSTEDVARGLEMITAWATDTSG